MSQYTFVPNSKTLRPIRYENLRPGSYFKIVAEPSRGLRKVEDSRIYWKSTEGFFSTHPASGLGIVLYPQDLVLPMRRVTLSHVGG